MFSMPEALPEHHRARQAQLETSLKSGKTRQLIMLLRDLSWKKWSDRLNSTDSQLRNRIEKRLITELAAHPNMSTVSVRQRVREIVEVAMQKHEATLCSQTAKA